MDTSIDSHITRLASSQHGVVTVEQLRACGLTHASISHRVQVGRLCRVRARVYAVGHTALSRHGLFQAAVLGAGNDAALSGASALELWGIRPARSAVVDVVTTRRMRGAPGIRYHQTRRLPVDEVTRRDGISVTTVARTIVDLGLVLRPLQLTRVLDEAAYRRRLNIRKLQQVMRRHRTSTGHPVVEQALEFHLGGSRGFRSGAERVVYERTVADGLPVPRVNTTVSACGEEIEVDLLWPDQRLCIEIDGHGHDRARTKREDAARDVLLRTAGYRIVRIPVSMVDRDIRGVVGIVRRALGADA